MLTPRLAVCRRTSNYRILCVNRLLGTGPELSDEVARNVSSLWGSHPVHPLPEAYVTLVRAIDSDILVDDVRHINPPKQHGETANQRRKFCPQPMQASLSRRLFSRDTLSSLGKERKVDGGSGNGRSRGNAGYRPRATRLAQEHRPRLQPQQGMAWEVNNPGQPSSYHEKYMEKCVLDRMNVCENDWRCALCILSCLNVL
jgi:hypothetical protein